jgi:hypothetical protein
MEIRTIKEALKIVGGLSHTSKMPCASYGLPAWKCFTGKALTNIEGTVCSNCYALKGRYAMPNVEEAQERRDLSLRDVRWAKAMAFIINKRKYKYFRWHDSGDLQGVWHLEKIIEVANACPDTKFWLPTREIHMVMKVSNIPSNLIIRLSAQMKEEFNPVYLQAYPFPNSGVTNDRNQVSCPSIHQGGKCGACRSCWNPIVRTVIYHEH